MGTLARFRFSPELIERFPVFIETGTGHGAGVKHAQQFGFRHILSVDTEEAIVKRAVELFADDLRVEVECGESLPFLEEAFKDFSSETGIILWLDAHFPGSDVLGVPYDSEENADRRLPLIRELELIRDRHPNAIVLIDDLRLYVSGPFAAGNVGLDHVGLTADERREAGLQIYDVLRDTHDCTTFYDETGYVAFTPRGVTGLEYVEFTGREYCEMARKNYEIGDLYGAKACYYKVLDYTDPPDTGWKRVARGEACRFMAAEAHENSHMGAELDWCHKALHADPLCVEYRVDLVNLTLLPLQWLDLARQEAGKACRIAPDDPKVWQTAANVECEAGDAEAAQRFADKAIEVGPANAGSYLIAAKILADTARWDEAIDRYRVAYNLADHRKAESLHGIAIVHDRQGDTHLALHFIDCALALETGDRTLMRWNRSEMLLTLGEYEEGWRDHNIRFDNSYRGRQFAAIGQLGRRFNVPLWTPEDQPCRVHVHPEMGFGDVICMARYLPMVQALGHDVRLEVKSHMVDLFTRSFPGVKVQEFAIDYPGALGLDEFDRHINMMSFPHVFGTTIDTIPWNGPYIKSPWRLECKECEGNGCVECDNVGFFEMDSVNHPSKNVRKKIGLCWSAGIRPGIWYEEYGKRKSMRFSQLAPLFSIDANFVSLQAGPERLENDVLSGLTEEAPDWADTAALIASLDLVITVDTAVAHLAGAMGKPTWLMMHTQGSWHWMRDRLDSPWYPSVRIFRQEKPHEWEPVVDAVAEALRNEVAR